MQYLCSEFSQKEQNNYEHLYPILIELANQEGNWEFLITLFQNYRISLNLCLLLLAISALCACLLQWL